MFEDDNGSAESSAYLSEADSLDRAQRLGERLLLHCADNGLAWQEVVMRLRDVTGERLEPGALKRQLKRGHVPVPLVYAICRLVDYNVWRAAVELGVLPEDPAAWLNRTLLISTTARIERYLRGKPPAESMLTTASAAGGTVEAFKSALKKRLPPGYELSVKVAARGKASRRPYHTYFLFRWTAGNSSTDRERAFAELDRAVDEVFARAQVNVHWEPSRDCKPTGHEDDDALIFESHFDNRPAPHQAPSSGPVVILGAYYSGAKDVAVLVANARRLGAIDLSRYVAESLVDTGPFRTALRVQAAAFWNLVQEPLGERLAITVDDYCALEQGQPRRLWKLDGLAVVLLLTARGLDYAAFRVACNRRDASDRREPSEDSVAACREELQAGQEALLVLAKRHFKHVKSLQVNEPCSPGPGRSYPDAVDEMFDQYVELAWKIVPLVASA